MDKTDHLSHPQASVRSNYNNWAQKIHWNALQGALFRLSPLDSFCVVFFAPHDPSSSHCIIHNPPSPFWKLYREVPSIRFKFIHSTQNLQNLNDLLISKQCLKARAMQADATNCTHPIENPKRYKGGNIWLNYTWYSYHLHMSIACLTGELWLRVSFHTLGSLSGKQAVVF